MSRMELSHQRYGQILQQGVASVGHPEGLAAAADVDEGGADAAGTGTPENSGKGENLPRHQLFD